MSDPATGTPSGNHPDGNPPDARLSAEVRVLRGATPALVVHVGVGEPEPGEQVDLRT